MIRNSLFLKLIGAFALVIAVGAIVISLSVTGATEKAFNAYTTRSSQNLTQRLTPILADFYQSNGNWQEVGTYLQTTLPSLPKSGSGGGLGQGKGMGYGKQYGSLGIDVLLNHHIILCDAQGIVIFDNQETLLGKQFTNEELSKGNPIIAAEKLSGTLIITPFDASGGSSPTSDFFASVNQSIVISVIIASIIALLLGTGLFAQIIAPLRQLKAGAVSIANGDLTQRVRIISHDEIGEVGLAFNKMTESLSLAEEQRKQLVADIAHELRTPLAAIQATLEGVLDGIFPFNNEQANILYEETNILNRLIGDLRILTLADSGQLNLIRGQVDLRDLIQQGCERIKPQTIQKEITIETKFQSDLPAVWIDSDRIMQVFSNLLNNAIHYCPVGGKITVACSYLADYPKFVTTSVTDSGPGILKEDIPFLFDRFYRGDKSRDRKSGGTGLGLAIVKQLVEAHGGSVEANSPVFSSVETKDFGTRIKFTLPIFSPENF